MVRIEIDRKTTEHDRVEVSSSFYLIKVVFGIFANEFQNGFQGEERPRGREVPNRDGEWFFIGIDLFDSRWGRG